MAKEVPIINFSDHGMKSMAVKFLRSLEGLHKFSVTKCRDQRSLAQQGYLWGVVYPVIANGLSEAWGEPWDSERVHSHCKDKFLRVPTINRRTGEVKGHETRSTQDLDVAQFGVYIDQCIELGLDYAGVEVPSPVRYGFGTPRHPLPAKRRERQTA